MDSFLKLKELKRTFIDVVFDNIKITRTIIIDLKKLELFKERLSIKEIEVKADLSLLENMIDIIFPIDC
jgi:hypothetical protein